MVSIKIQPFNPLTSVFRACGFSIDKNNDQQSMQLAVADILQPRVE